MPLVATDHAGLLEYTKLLLTHAELSLELGFRKFARASGGQIPVVKKSHRPHKIKGDDMNNKAKAIRNKYHAFANMLLLCFIASAQSRIIEISRINKHPTYIIAYIISIDLV